MRGVCALNLEAMHMFREPEDEDPPGESCDNQQRNPCALIGSGEGESCDNQKRNPCA